MSLVDRPCSFFGCKNTFRGSKGRKYCDEHGRKGSQRQTPAHSKPGVSNRLPLAKKELVNVQSLMGMQIPEMVRTISDWTNYKIDWIAT